MTDQDREQSRDTGEVNPVEPYMRKFRKELSAGTVSLVLLAVLENADRPMYGYEIAKILESLSTELAKVKQGTLYPVLRSMERSGLLESRVEPSVSGPPRRYYTVTEEGRKGLEQWKSTWAETRDFVDTILEGKHSG